MDDLEEKIGFDSKEEYVQWAQEHLDYKGDPDPRAVSEFLLNIGLCPIVDGGRIYIEA